jgi:hypothetical protein
MCYLDHARVALLFASAFFNSAVFDKQREMSAKMYSQKIKYSSQIVYIMCNNSRIKIKV